MKKLNQRKNYIVIILFSVALIFALALFCSCTVKTYSVTYSVIEGGTINGNANQTVKEGENGTEVTAVPNEGYVFVKWSDSVSEATRQEKSVTVDISVTAVFEKLTFNLSYAAGDGGYLIGNTTQTVAYGESGTKVTAIPNDGYKFVKWSDGVTKDTRCDTEVNSVISVKAEFEFLFAGGKGTQLNPYKIENYTQLLNMRYYPDKSYMLSCDLDLSGINHEPIFDANEYFAGIFFGNGKTIKNLTVATESNFPSLFGMVMGGVVDSLTLENVSITTTDYNTIEAGMQYYVGALAGYFAGRIDNVTVSGNITADGLSHDGVAIGGLVGWVSGSINDCNADIVIDISCIQRKLDTDSYYLFCFGGLVGVSFSTSFETCIAKGEINILQSIGDRNASKPISLSSGLIAYYISEKSENAIKNCQTDVVIKSAGGCCSGFIGVVEIASECNLIIINCIVNGDMNCELLSAGFIYNVTNYGEMLIDSCCNSAKRLYGYYRVAGFVYFVDNVSIKNCYVSAEIKAASTATGFCYQASKTQFNYCYSTGDIISNNEAYGFGSMISGCMFEKCFTEGNIHTKNFSSGFIHIAASSLITNCYSDATLFCSNIFENRVEMVNFYGFICTLMRTAVSNCYYSGQILAENIELPCEATKCAKFIGGIRDSELLNCHVLVVDNTINSDIVYKVTNSDADLKVDITVYKTAEEMYFLADILNEGFDEIVWINQEEDFPTFNFINK